MFRVFSLVRVRTALCLFLSAALAAGMCVPAGAVRAFAADVTSALPAPQEDGTSGAVLMTIDQTQATEVAAALGANLSDADSGETDGDSATAAGEQTNGCVSWEVLMQVSGDAVESADIANEEAAQTVTNATAQNYVIVRATSQKSSATALITWAKQIPGVVTVEQDSTQQLDLNLNSGEGEDEGEGEGEDEGETAGTQGSGVTYTQTPTFTDYQSSLYSYTQWFLNNAGYQRGNSAVIDFDVSNLYELAGNTSSSNPTQNSNDVVVAVIDSGVDYNNAALKSNMVDLSQYASLASNSGVTQFEYNAIGDSVSTSDYGSHGSHVAGIVVQTTASAGLNNGKGANILGIRVADASGTLQASAIVRALSFTTAAKKAGINVVAANESLGATYYFSAATRIATQGLLNAGVAISYAAGNSFSDLDDTANTVTGVPADGVLVVGATDASGQVAVYSDHGVRTVDVYAPGSEILSTAPEGGATAGYYSQVAYYMTQADKSDKSGEGGASAAQTEVTVGSKAALYEGFEAEEHDVSDQTSSATEQDIGTCLGFKYATFTRGYTTDGAPAGTAILGKIAANEENADIKTTTDVSYMGNSSMVLTQTNNAAVSRVLTKSDVDGVSLEAVNLSLNSALGSAALFVGFVDEAGNFYISHQADASSSSIDYSVATNSGLWSVITDQDSMVIPSSIREELASIGSDGKSDNGHTYRLAVVAFSGGSQVASDGTIAYVDSLSVGSGLTGLEIMSGTSMASPVVAGLLAIAAATCTFESADGTADRAAEVSARVYGSTVEYDKLPENETLAQMYSLTSITATESCASGGHVTIDGLYSPSPSPQKVTTAGNIATIEGYFFGDGTPSVTVTVGTDELACSVISYTGSSSGKSSVTVTLPTAATIGTYKFEITTADGTKCGRRYMYVDATTSSNYTELSTISQDLPEFFQAYTSIGSDSNYMYGLEFILQSEIDSNLEGCDYFNLHRYSYDQDKWTNITDHGSWSEVSGLKAPSGYVLSCLDAYFYTIDERLYVVAYLNMYDQDDIYGTPISVGFAVFECSDSGLKLACIADIPTNEDGAIDVAALNGDEEGDVEGVQAQSGTALQSLQTESAAADEYSELDDSTFAMSMASSIFGGDGNLYAMAYCTDVDTRAVFWRFYKIDPLSGAATYIGAIDAGFLDVAGLTDADIAEMAQATPIFVAVNGYIMIGMQGADNVIWYKVALDRLGDDDFDVAGDVSYTTAPYEPTNISNLLYSYTSAGKYLVATGVGAATESPVTRTYLFDTQTDTWIADGSILSGVNPNTVSVAYLDNTLYVRGTVNARVNGKDNKTPEFFRSLDITSYAPEDGISPTPTPVPDTPGNTDAVNTVSDSSSDKALTASALTTTGDSLLKVLVPLVLVAVIATVAIMLIRLKSQK